MPICKSCDKPTAIRVRAMSDDGTRCHADAYLCSNCLEELIAEGWLDDPNAASDAEKAALKEATRPAKPKGKKR
jgi:hypothetical protein